MPRRLRLQVAGGVFHIITRGNRHQPVFLEAVDREFFLRLLALVIARYGWTCHAYCLMGNHYHLLIETPDETLSVGMQWLNGTYAQFFNGRHGYNGHLFEGRFYSGLVQSDAHLIELTRYIVLNPVRAGLCTSAADWEWSSYRPATGAVPVPKHLTPNWLLAQFGRDLERGRAGYAQFVADAPRRARSP